MPVVADHFLGFISICCPCCADTLQSLWLPSHWRVYH